MSTQAFTVAGFEPIQGADFAQWWLVWAPRRSLTLRGDYTSLPRALHALPATDDDLAASPTILWRLYRNARNADEKSLDKEKPADEYVDERGQCHAGFGA